MFCPNCGTENEDRARFCITCGTRLPSAPEAEVPEVGPAPPEDRAARGRSSGWLLSGTGAAIAFVSFFLPWFTVSCNGMQIIEVSGQDLAGGMTFYGEKVFGYPYLWLALLAPMICLIIAGVAYARGGVGRGWAIGQALLPAAGLMVILAAFLHMGIQSRAQETMLGDLAGDLAAGVMDVSPGLGLWGTFLGYLAIVVGAVLGFRSEKRSHEVRKPGQAAVLVCPRCGAKNVAGAGECRACGAPLRQRGTLFRWRGMFAVLLGFLTVVIVALVLVVFVVGRVWHEQAGVVGRYYSQQNPGEYLELKADGTFYLKEMGIGVTGQWKLEEDVLTLSFPLGLAARARVAQNSIIDEEGEIWVKQGTDSTSSKTMTSLAGVFVRQDDPDEYLELLENGTLYAHAPTGERYPGTWTVDRDMITLRFVAGESAKAQIKGNSLILENGVVYLREGVRPAPRLSEDRLWEEKTATPMPRSILVTPAADMAPPVYPPEPAQAYPFSGPAVRRARLPAGDDIPIGDNPRLALPELAKTDYVYDFGDVPPDEISEAIITILNKGTRDLVIKSVRASCGCIAATTSSDVIPPGGTGQLRVTYDPTYNGDAGKWITRQVVIESNDPAAPVVELTIRADVLNW